MNNCTLCPLGENNKQYNYYYQENSKYLVITDYPTSSEVKSGIPAFLQGSLQRKFDFILDKAGIDKNTVSFATLTKCIPSVEDKSNQKTRDYIRKCVQANLNQFIQKVNPDVIIAITSDVCWYFTGKSIVEQLHGQLYYWKGFKVIPVFNPRYLSKKDNRMKLAIDDWSYAKSLANRGQDITDLTLRRVTNKKQFYAALKDLKKYSKFGADVETTGLDVYKGDKIFGIGIAPTHTKAYYFPIRQHSILGDGYTLYWNEKRMKYLQQLMENNQFTFHFSNFDTEFFQVDLEWDVKAANDSLTLAYTLDENRKKSLEYLTNHFYPDLVGFKEKSKKEVNKTKDFDKIPLKVLAERCMIDSIACLRLTDKFTKELYHNEKELYNYYERFRKPLLQLFVDLQKTGFKVDMDRVDQLDKKYTRKMKMLKNKMWDLAGKRFNPKSRPQLRNILYEEMDLIPPEGYYTDKTDKPQMNKDVFKELKKDYDLPILDHILEYKKLEKLKSTYVVGFRKSVVNGRIHPKFRSSVAKTGRSSSQKPNAQNIASDKDIKGLVIAPEGYNLIEMDYKQAEARLFAYLASSKKLAEVCYASDVYQKIAAMAEGKDFDEITKEVRDHYKMVVLALLYGMGDRSLAKTIGQSKRQAEQLRKKFFKMFPAVEQWKSQIIEELEKNGYVTSIYGRKRRIPSINSSKDNIVAEAKRQAVNFMVQSPTFDYVSMGLQRVHNDLSPFDARIILTVHDSILVEVKKEQTNDVLPVMKKAMIKPVPPIGKDAHMGVDAEVGTRWGYLEEVEI
jgi:DNA polymerase-1